MTQRISYSIITVFALSWVFAARATAEMSPAVDPDGYFDGYTWSLLLDSTDGEMQRTYDDEFAETPLSPCSTFKIPHALIGLTTEVVDGPDHLFKFEGDPTWNKSWNQDHTLRSALRQSVVWYFQRMARQIGEVRMQAALDSLQYGNRDISGGIDTFWLGSSLKITPKAQLAFLKALYEDRLPFPVANQRTVKDLMLIRETDVYTLRGKTGSDWDGKYRLGWFVGWIEAKDRTVFFVTVTKDGETPSGRNTRDLFLKWLEASGVIQAFGK